RWLGLLSMIAGMTALYLSQIRALLVMLGISVIALACVLMISGRLGRLLTVIVAAVALTLVGFSLAFSLGGETVTSRLATLTSESSTAVYYRNRGIFLEF